MSTPSNPSFIKDRLIPVGTIVVAIIIAWYFATYAMNAPFQRDQNERSGTIVTTSEFIAQTMAQPKPTLPAPHQVFENLYKNTFTVPITSKRSLVYNAWVTLSSTLLGFLMGTILGAVIAVGIVHIPALERSFLPWIIASQTIPMLAVAPMIIVILAAVGVTGILPKALISTYLSFFPVTVGMVKGLRSPDLMHLDLMRTYSASPTQTFWKLRVPASIPFFFTSIKVAVAASLVGAIVGELPTGAVAGIGAKLLAGSYYSQTIDVFAALFAGSVVAVLLVVMVDIVGRFVNTRMGGRPA
jgi:NitT/TauT family transport system permease protein